MRALAADTVLSMNRAIEGLGVPWTVGLRTGDTSSAERAKQARRLPSALVTTPESLSLMLSNADAREKLSELRLVVVDEWHELLGNKRGVQTELALARLRKWNPKLRTWGLSATLGNIDEAVERLLGSTLSPALSQGRARVVKGVSDKQVAIDTLIPPEVDKFPWAGHLGHRDAGPRGGGDRVVALDARLHQRAIVRRRSGTRRCSRRSRNGRA